QDEDAAPRPVAIATGRAPEPPSARWIRSRGTQAWTIAEMAKPRTKAHQTVQAMRKASLKPLAMVVSMACRQPSLGPRLNDLVQHSAHDRKTPPERGFPLAGR